MVDLARLIEVCWMDSDTAGQPDCLDSDTGGQLKCLDSDTVKQSNYLNIETVRQSIYLESGTVIQSNYLDSDTVILSNYLDSDADTHTNYLDSEQLLGLSLPKGEQLLSADNEQSWSEERGHFGKLWGNFKGYMEDEEEVGGAIYLPVSEEITEEDPGGDFYLLDNFTKENWDDPLVNVEVMLQTVMIIVMS